MSQVTGKFCFFQTDEELLIWYRVLVSISELPWNMSQPTTMYSFIILNFYLYTVHILLSEYGVSYSH